jgi:hypothetical protein
VYFYAKEKLLVPLAKENFCTLMIVLTPFDKLVTLKCREKAGNLT